MKWCRLSTLVAVVFGSPTIAASRDFRQITQPASSANDTCPADQSPGTSCPADGATAADRFSYNDGARGARVRSVIAKLADTTDVQDFAGCDATGVVDSTQCFQNALSKFSGGGGTLRFKGAYRIASSITIPAGVSLKGACDTPGTLGNNSSPSYDLYRCGVLRLANTATIALSSGASISSTIIYRSGMPFPSTDSSAYAGTAVTTASDDTSLSHIMIIGFKKGFVCASCQRPRIEYMYADNINNIDISNSKDIPWISHLHAWPFGTIGSRGGTSMNNGRMGDCIYLHDTVDWAHISDSFCYGYLRGIHLNNVNSTSIIGFGVDNLFDTKPIMRGSVGLYIEGNAADTRVYGLQAAAQGRAGVEVDASAGVTLLDSTTIWGGTDYGILISNGDTVVRGGLIGTTSPIRNGVFVASPSARVTVSGVRFGDLPGAAVDTNSANSTIFLSDNDFGRSGRAVGTSHMTVQSISASPALALPTTGNVFTVTGETPISSIRNGWAGRCVSLIFTGPLTLTNHTANGPDSLHLAGNRDMRTAANDTLTACHNGAQWFETARAH
ncbi:hypothetical protein [Sphingomonas sp. 10B4]|uniref:hypothetical protein n=1 Tax=Sphingomonas sp. 10B4 TaxID=3048575 RepID=UPI002AB53BEE|nr:hypothetical protein [Sphingomonas sp. 10B4]MDY7523891.1 hypothetical protein [Sphingomonas sp. 10B4]MEB0284128.1 hypothetical protein [Sphingomonas sp. 10B4]